MKAKLVAEIIEGKKLEEKPIIEFIKTLDGSDFALTEASISFMKNGQILLESKLAEFEKDFMTVTHLGQFPDGTKFRIVQPIGAVKEIIKAQGEKHSITFASLNPIGYAIEFETF
jgi:hypothetical protein